MEILNQGFDHVEFVVNRLSGMVAVLERMGFEKIGERSLNAQKTRSVLYAQGWVRVLLTEPTDLPSVPSSSATRFLADHAEGICVLAIEVKDATRTFHEVIQRGARPALEPQVYQAPEGRVVRSEVWTPGDVRYAFIERHSPKGPGFPVLFDQGLVAQRLKSPSPLGIVAIDHLTNNVGMGEMQHWVQFYKEIFGFQVTRHFDIRTGKTGLISDVIESPDRKIKVPINEATNPESQVQEFVNRMRGAGVQHLALLTDGLPKTLGQLMQQQFKFLKVPHTYYEAVPTRVPGVIENLQEMEGLGILLDGEGEGYLLQIFSEEILGPFFFEFIQRRGNQGFGEGNFKALFEAIERDQIRRGVLK
jgi:4-hydroxyphenylpyruvate dioxygenase